MSKDVILDKYARLYEIPNQLALLGHDVECFCLSYQSHDDGTWDESNHSKKLKWHSKSYAKCKKLSIWSYPFYLLNLLRENKPDVIIGASDMPHIIMGAWLAKKLDIPFVADLYDNFEGFGQAKIPGMTRLFRRAVKEAQLITTTSQPLAELVEFEYGARGVIISMPSTIDTKLFKPSDKDNARRILGLSKNKKYIGTAGGLYRDKGIEVVYAAWEKIRELEPNVDLILAGPYEEDFPPPIGDRVHYLGSLSHENVATLFQALDVGIISILDTPFGRYCFPQKAYEMLACNLSIVVSDIGEMSHLFATYPDTLFRAGNVESLVEKLLCQLSSVTRVQIPIEDWVVIITKLEPQIRALAKHN
ncbi:glycosyltransferase family 4 protein [Acinetobacter faecalis]|uniref:glycosyltransferase family 4 protein n=1 Tax=Acinetobacter faecalis TaxID=2665161 RepID=UPI002A91D928|nr:glycosyltransferase family 4 protein [Acinetobacter faecalis]MDY6529231.1 glycosyltransferase family 4 protein [Acinetobacter faecalis]